jgi:hypothetical protein
MVARAWFSYNGINSILVPPLGLTLAQLPNSWVVDPTLGRCVPPPHRCRRGNSTFATVGVVVGGDIGPFVARKSRTFVG